MIVTFITLGSILINAQPLHAHVDSTKPSEYTHPFDMDLFDFDRDSENPRPEDNSEPKETHKKEETLRQILEDTNQITIEV